MKTIFNPGFETLSYLDKIIQTTCVVRNELNGLRLTSEKPCRTEGPNGKDGVPYMPRPFPKGLWIITGILDKNDPYEAPEFIATNAHQPVEEWEEIDEHYGKKTGRVVEDYGYGFHNSTSQTTLGCGRILEAKDRLDFVKAIQAAWQAGEEVFVEVI
jgi:hypothetical protein